MQRLGDHGRMIGWSLGLWEVRLCWRKKRLGFLLILLAAKIKGLLDNALSDYLWAKAVLLTKTTAATAGLTIQVPIAAVVDSLTGHDPRLLDYIGAAAVIAGFVGINIPSTYSSKCEAKEQDGAANVS